MVVCLSALWYTGNLSTWDSKQDKRYRNWLDGWNIYLELVSDNDAKSKPVHAYSKPTVKHKIINPFYEIKHNP